MNWISVNEKLPEMHEIEGTESAMSDLVLVWAIDDPAEPGFPETARLCQGRWDGWLWNGDGTMEDDGFIVTHWALVEAPKDGGQAH